MDTSRIKAAENNDCFIILPNTSIISSITFIYAGPRQTGAFPAGVQDSIFHLDSKHLCFR